MFQSLLLDSFIFLQSNSNCISKQAKSVAQKGLENTLKCVPVDGQNDASKTTVEEMHILQQRKKDLFCMRGLRQSLSRVAKVLRLQRLWECALHQLWWKRWLPGKQVGRRLKARYNNQNKILHHYFWCRSTILSRIPANPSKFASV